jgi:hypothetical protein
MLGIAEKKWHIKHEDRGGIGAQRGCRHDAKISLSTPHSIQKAATYCEVWPENLTNGLETEDRLAPIPPTCALYDLLCESSRPCTIR